MTKLPEKIGNGKTFDENELTPFQIEYLEASKEYLSYIKNIRRYSPHTVSSYKNTLRQFGNYVFRLGLNSLEGITIKILRKYIVRLSEALYSSKSINQRLHCLSSFFKHCARNGRIKQNRAKLLPRLKELSKVIVYLSEAEMNHFYDNMIPVNTFTGIRNRYIIDLFYSSGIRVSELVNLKERNISKDMLKVEHGKGGDDRYIPLPKKFLVHHAEYMKAKSEHYKKHKIKKSKDEPLVVSRNFQSVTRMFLYRLVKKTFAYVKDKEVTPHTLRHSIATHLMNAGAPINAIKDFLGHRTIVSTAKYTHVAISRLVEIHKQHFPSTENSLKKQSA